MEKQHGNKVANARRKLLDEHTPRQTQGNTKNIKVENPCLDGIHRFWF